MRPCAREWTAGRSSLKAPGRHSTRFPFLWLRHFVVPAPHLGPRSHRTMPTASDSNRDSTNADRKSSSFSLDLREWPIARKLAAICLLFGIVPLGAASIIMLNRATAAVRERAQDSLKQTAGHIADKIDRNLFERYGDVQAFGLNDVVQDRTQWYKVGANANKIAQATNAYMAAYGIYVISMVVDADGRVVSVNDKDATGKPIETSTLYANNYADAAWFKSCMAGSYTRKMAFSDSLNTVASGTVMTPAESDKDVAAVYSASAPRVVGFAAPIRNASGGVIGCWFNQATTALVTTMLADAAREITGAGYPNAAFTVIDSTGNTIAEGGQKTADSVLMADQSDKGVVAQLKAGKSGTAVVAISGREMAVGFAHLKGALGYPGINWGVAVAVPEAEIDAAANLKQLKYAALAISLVSATIILLVALRLGASISRPVGAMADVAHDVALGRLDRDAVWQWNDEIGRVALSMNSIVREQRKLAATANAIAAGNTNVEIHARSEHDELSTAFASMRSTLDSLVQEMKQLSDAAQQGKLDARGNATKFQGAFNELVAGVNATLEAGAAPVREARDVMAKLAQRDLTARMHGEYRGEYAALAESLNLAVSDLGSALRDVQREADSINASTQEIASAAQEQANGATRQAGLLESVSANVSEQRSLSDDVATRSRDLSSLVSKTSDAAREGHQRVEAVAGALATIRDRALMTQKIARKMEEIASQTNLLALNAAVEAARAGEAGAGFAVVAGEVRALALRATESAKETQSVIDEVVKSVVGGVKLGEDAVESLTSIQKNASDAATVVVEITAATDAQARGLVTIDTSTASVSTVTSAAAANAEETAASAQEMSTTAATLAALVGRFSLSDEESASPRSHAEIGRGRPAPRKAPARGGYAPSHHDSLDSW
jgi:methyl-accepting chemotaxis protein